VLRQGTRMQEAERWVQHEWPAFEAALGGSWSAWRSARGPGARPGATRCPHMLPLNDCHCPRVHTASGCSAVL